MPSASGGFAPLNRGSAPGPCWGTAPRPPHRLALPRSPYSFVAFQFFFLQETNPDYSLGQQVSSDHAKPRLRNLRWLVVGQRVIFKTADPVWKCINSVAAVYLQELCTQVDNIRARSRLRSASPGCIQLPRMHSVRLRNDLYCVEWCVKLYSNQPSKRVLHNGALLTVAPAVWNSLPATLRDSSVSLHTFKRRLCSMMNTIRSCCGAFARRRYIRLLTYLLTYFLLAGGPG